jgi:hypothetical protein
MRWEVESARRIGRLSQRLLAMAEHKFKIGQVVYFHPEKSGFARQDGRRSRSGSLAKLTASRRASLLFKVHRSSLRFAPRVHATCRSWIEPAAPLAHGGR